MKKVTFILLILISASISFAQNWLPIETIGPPNGELREMYWDEVDSVTYIVGTFKYVNGVEINGVCKYDGQQIIPLNTGFDNFVGVGGPLGMGEMKRYQDKLYFGHSWSTIDSVDANGIATWDGENWNSVGEGLLKFEDTPAGDFSGTGYSMDIFQNSLYVTGVFDIAGTDTTQNIARWDGENWFAVPHPYGTWGDQGFHGFYTIKTFGNHLYVSGNFDTPDGKRSIVRYDGENWETVGAGILGGQDFPFGMIIYHDELYMYGSMRKIAGNAGNKIMKLKNDEWVEVGGGIVGNGSRISDAVVMHDKLYLSGLFSHVGDNLYFPNFVAWDGEKWCGTGTEFSGFQGSNVSLGEIERFGDDMLLGGNFLTIDGDSINKIARWIGGDYLEECGEIVSTNNESDANLQLSIAPNPTSQTINLHLQDLPAATTATISLLDPFGKAVLSTQQALQAQHTLEVAHLPAGVYFLVIELEGQRYVEKVVVQ